MERETTTCSIISCSDVPLKSKLAIVGLIICVTLYIPYNVLTHSSNLQETNTNMLNDKNVEKRQFGLINRLMDRYKNRIHFSKEVIKRYVSERNRDPPNPYGNEGRQRFPNAIVIGVRKAGTRAVLDFLNLHPDVRIALGECHFFSNHGAYKQGLEFYRREMPFSLPNQMTIEKTPSYFHKGQVTAPAIRAMNSSIKLILVVREPTHRAISDYVQFEQMKGETKPFEKKAIHTSTGKVKRHYGPVLRSTYIVLLRNFWFRNFPKDNIHIVNGDALGRQNPGQEMILLQRFLGLREVVNEDTFKYDTKKGFYCPVINGTTTCLSDSKGRNLTEVDSKVVDKLKRYFATYNKQLFEFAERDFGWNS